MLTRKNREKHYSVGEREPREPGPRFVQRDSSRVETSNRRHCVLLKFTVASIRLKCAMHKHETTVRDFVVPPVAARTRDMPHIHICHARWLTGLHIDAGFSSAIWNLSILTVNPDYSKTVKTVHKISWFSRTLWGFNNRGIFRWESRWVFNVQRSCLVDTPDWNVKILVAPPAFGEPISIIGTTNGSSIDHWVLGLDLI